jgi:coenzyme PQQ precursor peptide PqqA
MPSAISVVCAIANSTAPRVSASRQGGIRLILPNRSDHELVAPKQHGSTQGRVKRHRTGKITMDPAQVRPTALGLLGTETGHELGTGPGRKHMLLAVTARTADNRYREAPRQRHPEYPVVGHLGGKAMKWLKPTVQEYCVGMEVTSYESADIDPDTLI